MFSQIVSAFWNPRRIRELRGIQTARSERESLDPKKAAGTPPLADLRRQDDARWLTVIYCRAC
ncbi:MAG: hypothetical protein HY822_15265 [Acidobacteria bacterium]|nr:hypothetical protein [Acidobacteriota bacterium]